MLFNTIKNTTITLTVVTLIFVCSVVVFLSLHEHENLYRKAITDDLRGLSENFSNDFIPLIANEVDSFELATQLLKLDVYEDIEYAVVFNKNWLELQTYKGKSFVGTNAEFLETISYYSEHEEGFVEQEKSIIAIKRIGDERFPLGYLLIAYDFYTPLKQSKTDLLQSILPVVLFVVLLVIVIFFLIQQHLFSPLMRLSQLAQEIQKTKDYSLRIDVQGSSEVAELSKDINAMMAVINNETEKNLQQTQRLKQQQRAMEKLANFDTLTGLPNRKFFMETLRSLLASSFNTKNDLTLLYLDLDGFKEVNDSLGHETGDELLINVCKRVNKLLNNNEIFARLGGDEFLILLTAQITSSELKDFASLIVKTLAKPFNIKSWNIQIGVSIGVANASDSNFNLSEFISNADLAMYRSKLAGKGVSTLFTPDMMEDNKRKILIANAISSALVENEFCLHYQAKFSPEEKIVGYEALIRWTNKDLGVISPAEFIPIAEQSGKIINITRWVLQQVCKEMQQIQEIHNDVVVSVNLSAIDIKNIPLLPYINSLFKKYNIQPHWFEFEVTESAYLENFEMANKFFHELKKMGVSIALDDFGTGYSSLGYLTQIHLNTLKIDKQFVDNINISSRSTLITETIIEMAKNLDLKICAEGVETREQADFLIAHGCHQLQGFLFAKPAKVEDLSDIS